MSRPSEFGLFLSPEAAAFPRALRQVEIAERAGLDLVGIQDHPYQPAYLDAFALIGNLLARTDRLRFFPAVANLPLRPPAMIAKVAASLDVMSGGRFELGIGAGALWKPIEAMGGPARTPGESVAALAEAIEIIRLWWSGERSIRHAGEHYRVDGAHPGPPPAHPIGVWVGAYRPRMLELTGRLGDGWFPSLSYAPPEAVPGMVARLERGAAAAGRDPEALRRIYNLGGTIADGPTRELLHGPPAHWVEELTRFAVELGFDSFLFWPQDDTTAQLERFAREVVPGVRERLAARRGA